MAVPVTADLKLSKLLTGIIKGGMNWDGRALFCFSKGGVTPFHRIVVSQNQDGLGWEGPESS